ncbi:G-D-S-L family lipolytic protein [Nostoc sp. FACHB-87]|uniref:SGNH/GDSL hydrolase family protein n=1 Tax=Nostocales TaxID=1161 RepID=UPI0016858318|nr:MULTISPECIES: GDSL-type esterase/lipase family protein [Nostocales]MBD2299831.1 G-D-S-L family lipolytic protein [Nostoc sp. FACHB-190]MBD2458596.1 G-D-S-L family lipolytic protein [Nostoc sp. FACHB-87]MBD2479738.1 G-D-S-L family lipolytic protein [Anabaena sp. FACHB-83]MBD2490048.1 G-D-S-L family lipolytic protein [Aulosira sp. FACHB-615]
MTTSAKTFPTWALLSLATNGILMLAVILLILQKQRLTAVFGGSPSQQTINTSQTVAPELGRHHQLNYQQWLDILKQEAQAATEKNPEHLSILVGDSISLWFPTELLPENRYWLNQAVSGENSTGLLKRLDIFDSTKPEVIFVMIGINDLIRGESDEVILENLRQIIRYLRKTHPTAKIVVQSILPHGAEEATWEGRDKLLTIPNSRIRLLNEQLQRIATRRKAKYLDLYSLFANQQGNLRPELSTDGLHLSPAGYLVWRTALQIYTTSGSGE